GTGGHASTSSSSSASTSGATGGKGTGGTGTGGTGTGGKGTGGMATGGASSSSSSSTSSSGANLCGNGHKDPGEDCDGPRSGGTTCQSLGFEGGTLTCNPFCPIIVSGCIPLPNCLDPSVLCTDPGCVGKPGCVDSCMPPFMATVPGGFVSGNITGRPTT